MPEPCQSNRRPASPTKAPAFVFRIAKRDENLQVVVNQLATAFGDMFRVWHHIGCTAGVQRHAIFDRMS